MFTLPYVFSSGALFQQNSTLTIAGTTSPNAAVTASVACDEGILTASTADSDETGSFSVRIQTPHASFKPYTVTLSTDKGDKHIMTDVLFGEIWLASGQSNMELMNSAMHDTAPLYSRIREKKIRVFSVAYPPFGAEGNFPWEPDHMAKGAWLSSDKPETFDPVSALATAFSDKIYDFLNRNADIPVGFLNATWGGTSMCSWLPRDLLSKDDYLVGRMKKVGQWRTPEDWNTAGGGNFQQCSAQYNVKIALLEGLQVRGVLWYQGENEAGAEFDHRIYADYLRFYHKVYTERFAADKNFFMMLSSLLYPWTYGPSGECSYGYLNEAFIETAVESPDKFAFMPIADLEPEWSYHTNNHPIHPTHKYKIGERLASLAIANVYGGDTQKSPATLEKAEAMGEKLRLTFRNVGTGLRIDGRAHGLYVAGSDRIYLPAEYEILSENTMDVWCDEISEPVHAAYAMQSLEPRCNLCAGEYPAAPFYTDRENRLHIEARPWYDTAVHTLWVNKMHDDVLDLFLHPVWLPIAGSEVCHDTAFRRESAASIRVSSDVNLCGCRVKSYPYNRLDFANFAALEVSLYNTNGLSAKLAIQTDAGETDLPLEKVRELGGGWSRYRADFSALPEGEIRSMIFSFYFENNRYPFVNLEKVRLIRK